ncbi:MAG TPA: MFS transporter [Acidobacteriota bacterium]|nr:MFS transporter [Acidobacteriota bacterium]
MSINQETVAGSEVATSTWRQGQVALTSFLALFSIVGLALYGLPLFYDYMVTDFGWSRAQVTSGNALSKLVVGPLFGFLAGWIVDRFGPRKMMVAGILMAGTALFGLSMVSTLSMFYLFYLFNALGYVCGGPLPNQVLISTWFDKARGKAMGFAYLGIGIGFVTVPQLQFWLTENYGWHTALRVLGILIVVIALPMALLVKEAPASKRMRESSAPVPIRGVLKSPYFYLLAVGSMCSIAAVGGTNQNLKLFLRLDEGFPEARIATFISLIAAASIFGRLFMGWLADRIPKKYVMILIYLLVGFSIPLLFVPDMPGALYLFAILFGIGLGGDYMIIPLMAAEIFGVRVMGRVMGIILTADGVAEATGPWLVGYLRDQTGSYSIGFSLLIALAFLGTIAVAMLPKKGKGEVQ